MTSMQITVLITLATATLGACATATPAIEDHSEAFGTANKSNIAAQFVPPTAEQKANTYIPADSNRRSLAKQRYRKDEVEKPVPIGTMN